MPLSAFHFTLQNELHEAIDELDEKHDKPLNLKIFRDLLEVSKRIDYDLNTPYGAELSHKTILHLALEEEDGLPYVEELLLVTLNRNNWVLISRNLFQHGASASHYNSRIGTAPIHVAAQSAYKNIFKLLLKDPQNRADVNIPNKDGLTAFHLLLAKLLDLAALETKSHNHEQLESEMVKVFDCLQMLADQSDLRMDFENAVSGLKTNKTNVITIKKLSTMTPLQILCSFQTWNAKNVADVIHDKLQKLVATLLDKGIDPNATAAKNALPGTYRCSSKFWIKISKMRKKSLVFLNSS